MKKLFLLLSFILISSSAFSQVLLHENFDYPAGDSITKYTWIAHSGGITNKLLITSPGLVYPGYMLSGIGNAVSFVNTGQDAYRGLIDSTNTGSVYASFMVRIDSSTSLGDYFLALLQTGSTIGYEGRVQARVRSGNLNFGITKGNSSSDTNVAGIWTGSYSLGTTYLLVLKYTFVAGTGTDDQVSLFVFSAGLPSTEPVATVGPITYGSSDATSIGRIAIRQGGSTRASYGVVDGIRVATNWPGIYMNIKFAIQGLASSSVSRLDTAQILTRNNTSPFAVVETHIEPINFNNGVATFTNEFFNVSSGTYYFEIIYRNMPAFRNGINTYSSSGGTPLVSGSTYDFTIAAAKAFGSNQIQVGSVFATYNGDAVQDGAIDVSDIVVVYNDAATFASGYLNTDITGDDFVDVSDLVVTYNNSANFVGEITP